jgi:transcriptional regulator with GAF, ATPase, and Fis domain
MVTVNCGALPEGLLESELFGHEQGAFTGATRARRGYFELADGGTIFLDEIGDLPLHLQVKLLRVLEDRTVRRVGSERTIPVNVRVMAATNRQLEVEVSDKRFRADLYYRLAVVTLTVPPLRERREDIPDLVQSYVDHFSTHLGRQVCQVTPPALDALTRYSWPGNVRELINVIERAVLLCPKPAIDLGDLPRAVAAHACVDGPTSEDLTSLSGSFRRMFDVPLLEARQEVSAEFERLYLTEALRKTDGRIGQAAERAGINQRSLYQMMRRHGLRKEDFKKQT